MTVEFGTIHQYSKLMENYEACLCNCLKQVQKRKEKKRKEKKRTRKEKKRKEKNKK